jgi:hypothetical protein
MTELERVCKDFIETQRIRCADSVYQDDLVIQNAYEFIKRVCELVGYFKDEESPEDTDA